MRVSMSEIGSVMLIASPARLAEARDLAAHRGLAELRATQPELAVVTARAARDCATIAQPDRVRILRQRLQLLLRGRAFLFRGLRVADELLERGAFSREALHGALTARVLLEHRLLCHRISSSPPALRAAGI